jgi:osmotically-inducible protein OsmY
MARRTRTSRRKFANRLAAAALALVGGTGVAIVTIEAWPTEALAGQSTDWTLQLQIRDALGDFPALARLNIAVRIQNGIVTLQGPVPTPAIGQQAVALVRKTPGVTDVRNELYIPGPDDRLALSMPRPVTAQRPPDKPEPPAISKSSAPVALAQTVSLSLADQIERLRQRDRRFNDIRIEIKDGRVILRGAVTRSQDAWDFADQVGRLPGVASVSQNVSTKN